MLKWQLGQVAFLNNMIYVVDLVQLVKFIIVKKKVGFKFYLYQNKINWYVDLIIKNNNHKMSSCFSNPIIFTYIKKKKISFETG